MLRTAALAAVALLSTALLGSWSAALGSRGVARADEVVALGTMAGGTLVAAWYTLTATVLLLAQLAELGRRAPRLARGLRAAVAVAGAPLLRRAAVLGVGAGLALAAVPASAGPVTDDTVPHDLRPGIGSLSGPAPPAPGAQGTAAAPPPAVSGGGTPSLEEPSARGTPEPAAEAETDAPSDGSQGGSRPTVADATDTGTPAARSAPRPLTPPVTDSGVTAYVVEPGDSLWSIARAHLGENATDAEVAAEWPRWHTTNRAVIGTDPHLIHPGQPLLAPDPKEQR